jgi:glycosyltransferase involved in cell wall biosynthesis
LRKVTWHVDVVMPTFNSNTSHFPTVLRSVMSTLKPHHLVAVDRHSRDGTQNVLREYAGDKLKLVELDVDLAYARKVRALLADTEVIYYIDVIILPYFKPLIEKALSILFNCRLGALALSLCSKEGSDSNDIKSPKLSRVVRPLSMLSANEVLKRGLHVYSCGFTFFFCIKRKLVETWDPPISLSAYEDYHLSQHVLHRGYLWVELSVPCVVHMKEFRYKGLNRYIRQGLWEGANVLTAGIPLRYVIIHVIGRVIGALYNKNPCQFLTYVGYAVGLVASRRFKLWRR